MIQDIAEWRELLDYRFRIHATSEEQIGTIRVNRRYQEEWPFLVLEDIKRVLYVAEGAHDYNAEWLMLCELYDGKFAHIYAGCCYTGFSAAGSADCMVADSLQKLWSSAVTYEQKFRYILNKRIVPQVQELVNAVRSRT